jgi:hypothetical protein
VGEAVNAFPIDCLPVILRELELIQWDALDEAGHRVADEVDGVEQGDEAFAHVS